MLASPPILWAAPDRLFGEGAPSVPERGLRAPSWGCALCAPCSAPLDCIAALEISYCLGGVFPAVVCWPLPLLSISSACRRSRLQISVPGDCRRREPVVVEVLPVTDKKNHRAENLSQCISRCCCASRRDVDIMLLCVPTYVSDHVICLMAVNWYLWLTTYVSDLGHTGVIM